MLTTSLGKVFLFQRFTTKSAVPDVVGADRVVTKAIFPSGLMVFALLTVRRRLMPVESWLHSHNPFVIFEFFNLTLIHISEAPHHA